MQDSSSLLRVTLQLIRDAVVTTDSGARVQMLSPAAEVLCGLTTEEAAGKSLNEIFPISTDTWSSNDAVVSLSAMAEEAIRSGNASKRLESFLVRVRDGHEISVEVEAAAFRTADGVGCVLVLHDMSRTIELAERMSHSALHDRLTGLPNRILLVDRLEQATKFADRNNEQLAVIFVGLDDIGRVRHEAGNTTADELLREVAYRIGAVMRESDTVCRLGADEFVVLVPNVHSLGDVEAVAAKLIDEIARPHVQDVQTVQTACSLGISTYPTDANDAATLMRLADGAMRQARGSSRGRYRFVGGTLTQQDRPGSGTD